MKYLKEFANLTDANNQGAAGLMAPHVSIINGKSAVNIYNANGASAFTCTFNENGGMVIPEAYSGWKPIRTLTPEGGFSFDTYVVGSAGCSLPKMEFEGATVELTDKVIKITMSDQTEVTIPLYNRNSKYSVGYGYYDMMTYYIGGSIIINNDTLDMYQAICGGSLLQFVDITKEGHYDTELTLSSEILEYIKGLISGTTEDIDVNLITDIHAYVPSDDEIRAFINNTTYETTFINNGGTQANWDSYKEYLGYLIGNENGYFTNCFIYI